VLSSERRIEEEVRQFLLERLRLRKIGLAHHVEVGSVLGATLRRERDLGGLRLDDEQAVAARDDQEVHLAKRLGRPAWAWREPLPSLKDGILVCVTPTGAPPKPLPQRFVDRSFGVAVSIRVSVSAAARPILRK